LKLLLADTPAATCLFGSSRLLGEKNSMNVGKNTSRGNGNSSQQLVELLIILLEGSKHSETGDVRTERIR
jgi:hypothetical protein